MLRQYLGESSRAGGQGIGAARLGGDRGYGGGILKDPEWIRYRDLILESVKKNWFWHDKSSNLRAIVSFNISRDGRIYNVTLKETSGVSSFDQSCVKAVLSTYRLPPPPERFYQDFQLVEIIFIPSEMLGG
ncbi:MAG: TonB C-terminal domain-containing protein [Deltaproteobacteria bacterium]|nr:TonB C-terminal domain-containing protein [Deltaproteobacteria bacterium]